MAEAKEDLRASRRDGEQKLVVWADKGMGMTLRYSIDIACCFACPVQCAMLLCSVGFLWMIGGPHSVSGCDEICKDARARIGEVEEWMINFEVRILKLATCAETKRKLAKKHNRAHHSGHESSVP